jgi:hypothetical protein
MRTLLHRLGAAIETQPFYSEEIRAVRFAVEAWRFRLPDLDRFLG